MGELTKRQVKRDVRVAQVTRPRAEAVAAAHWWAEAIRRRDTPDTGDDRNDGVLAGFQAMTGDAFKYPTIVIDMFEAELAAGIEAEIVERETRCGRYSDDAWAWYIHVGCDYHPDGILGDAAVRAGMENCDSFVFPCKTSMTIDRGKVIVSAGYGAGDETVWASDEGVKYWASRALVECANKLNDLANGAMLTSSTRALNVARCAAKAATMRAKEYDAELPRNVRRTRDKSKFGDGLAASLEIASAIAAQNPQVPEATKAGGARQPRTNPMNCSHGNASPGS